MRFDRSLRRRIVGAQRLDGVADELEADRLSRAGGIEVHDAAADAELAGLVGRILAGVAGLRQPIAKIDRRHLVARTQREAAWP